MAEDKFGKLSPDAVADREEWAIMYRTYVDGPYDAVYYSTDSIAYLNEQLSFGEPKLNGKELEYVVVHRDKPGWRLTRTFDLERIILYP